MTGIVTRAGLDVHAHSTYLAAIDAETGELVRARFGPGIDEPIAWLGAQRAPLRACYEAGPTGFGLYRAAVAAGVEMQVIAPGKTPRGPSDRGKTDRKDAELYPKPKTWTVEHRRWLSSQRFPEAPSDAVFADLLAAVDGISSRNAAIALSLSQLACDEPQSHAHPRQ